MYNYFDLIKNQSSKEVLHTISESSDLFVSKYGGKTILLGSVLWFALAPSVYIAANKETPFFKLEKNDKPLNSAFNLSAALNSSIATATSGTLVFVPQISQYAQLDINTHNIKFPCIPKTALENLMTHP